MKPFLWPPLVLACALPVAACGSSSDSPPAGAGGAGGADAGGDGGAGTQSLGPGEVCETPDPGAVRIRWKPGTVVLAPGASRAAVVHVDPDFCVAAPITFEVGDASVVARPADATVDYGKPTIALTLQGLAKGTTKITAKVPRGDGTSASSDLLVDVRDDALPACSGTAQGKVKAGSALAGSGGLAGASIALPAGAAAPNQGSFLWHVDDFDATIACGAGAPPAGLVAIGPAIRFAPGDPAKGRFPREIPLTVPVNPARMPERARMRHLQVWYSSPQVPTPRAIPVADPAFVLDNGVWSLRFLAPALGTYQPFVRADAGAVKRQRKLTHRAVIGVSMGGGGTAGFGARHHDLFDVLAPLGGPVDWTWLLHYIEYNHLAGFPPVTDPQKPPQTTIDVKDIGPPEYPYEHRQTFNQWWYEFPKEGNGGTFSRRDYVQIFRDLALAFGNPNGQNDAPGAENLPTGVPPDDKSVVGDHPGRECAVWLDPIKTDPDVKKQQDLEAACPAERCKYTLKLQSYFDDEYNPEGKWPVISVCDGAPQIKDKSPWANTWTDQGNDFPLEVGLAVDYNGNGKRDANEPILRAGHEPWDDVGADGKASKDEPGYQPGVNEDPAGDDYHPQFNPTGTEGDGRWQPGEPFKDVGLDGVANTPAAGKKYDAGEGDGKFTACKGLQTFWDRDPRAVLRQWVVPPGGAMDDAALSRTDWWTDGGTRDLFNFAVAAQHLAGALAARGRPVVYYTSTATMPGQDPSAPTQFGPGVMAWEDVPGAVMYRYGKIDPTPLDVQNGSGQHVGTADEIARRLQAALYFIGARWPDAPRARHEEALLDPTDAPPACKAEGCKDDCEILGNCTFAFTSKGGRKGPVQVSLPQGYGNKKLQKMRYPVIYLLHGYGQTPEDLGAAIVFLNIWMNGGTDSQAGRLGKAILVYVDGRCRRGPSGDPECIRGTFFADSVRAKGAPIETWWLELMQYVDARFRTMGASEAEVVE